MTISYKKLPKKDQAEIKRRFIEGESVRSLATEYDTSRSGLQYYVDKEWKTEKEMLKSELFNTFTTTKKESFIKMSHSAIRVIERTLSELAARKEPPTIMEAKRATEILESLDKITRLDENKPTEITETQVISIEDLRKKIAIDPFADIEEIEYEEIN